jgi:[ribosomal protein S5]-alanine N-acetyltransferase
MSGSGARSRGKKAGTCSCRTCGSRPAGGWTRWRVADQRGLLVGRAGFGGHGPDRELGYTIHRDMWGQGVASEIAQALVRWHREHNGTVPPMRLLAYGH